MSNVSNFGDIDAAEIDSRLRVVLPENYKEGYEELEPAPMRSAGLKFAADGRVAWDEIWGSFCDLAMAGGPPHKGKLLRPASVAEIEAQPDRYAEVVREICRGVELVTSMPCEASEIPGWVTVECYSDTMAAWLLRAITIENVSVRAGGALLHLPASPSFRLEKEIKNVITVIAKTSHYWLEHMPRLKQRAIAGLFAALESESPLVEPPTAGSEDPASDDAPPGGTPAASVVHADADALAANISRVTGLAAVPQTYDGWIGFSCPDVRTAVWMMRALVVLNVLARREDLTLLVPVNPVADPNGARVAAALRLVTSLRR